MLNTVLLAFPFVVVVLSTVGFLLGVPISVVHLPLSMLVTFALCIYLDRSKALRFSAILLSFVGVSVVLSAIPFMYTVTDGATCHRPGTFLLAMGWNPIYEADYSQLKDFAGLYCPQAGLVFHGIHVAYVPHAAWIYGAVFYKVFGFVEVMDSLNIYLLFVCVYLAYSWIRRVVGLARAISGVAALVVASCPYAIEGIFGGLVDPAVYYLTVVAVFSIDSFYRTRVIQHLIIATFALVLSSGIKFSGLTITLLLAVVPVIMSPRCRRMYIYPLVVLSLVCMINVAPCITSLLNHGTVFYPSQSLQSGGVEKDSMTSDFDIKNVDAQQMGYCGRFAYAYISKDLTKKYYSWKLNKDCFNPQLLLFHDIDGLGPVFRLALLFSLVVLYFIKDVSLRVLMVTILLSIFLLPGKYMGYGRYVSQIYIVPILAIFGVVKQSHCGKRWYVVGVCLLLYALPQCIKPLLSYPYMWLMSVQNLQIAMAMEQEKSARVATRFYYCASSMIYDINRQTCICGIEELTKSVARYTYSPCSGKYYYLTDIPIVEFRTFACAMANHETVMDKSFSSVRRKGIERYFLLDFLPKEFWRVPIRLVEVLRIRRRQFIRSFRGAE